MQIEIQGLRKSFGSTIALDGVNFSTSDPMSILTLIGPSGGGKSTLLRILGGLEQPDSGHLAVNGKTLPKAPKERVAYRRAMGFVFQHFNLFPHLDIERNLTLPLEKVHGQSSTQAKQRAYEVLEQFGLAPQAKKFPSQLSGGQAQRVALARAIAPRPRLLLLDEPTSALDPEITADLLDGILQLARGGQEIILSTHEMGFARALDGTVCFLSAGKVGTFGPAQSLFANPNDPQLARFLSRVTRFTG